MAETTCSDAQSDTEDDSNFDSLLQQLKSPSYQETQQCMSDICGASETGEGFDLLCDQSSSQLTLEENSSRLFTSLSGACGEMSPGRSAAFVSPSPCSVSNSSMAATAGTHCDLAWPSVTDDESASEILSSPHKVQNKKTSPAPSPHPRRPAIPNYQTMTPWTNESPEMQQPIYPPASQEIPCFPLDDQRAFREQSLKEQSGAAPASDLVPDSTAITETVYSLTSSSPNMSVSGQAQGRRGGSKRPISSADVPCVTREKRFRKTADALQKCGLWDIAMKTGDLIKRNAELQKQIDHFRSEATMFLKAVVQNPENRELMDMLTAGVPLTLGNRVCVTDGFDSDTAANNVCRSKVSDGNSSTTSGYASYTEGGSKQTSPTRK